MMKFLAQSNPFGTVNPPPGFGLYGSDPTQGASNLLTAGIRLFFIFVGLTAFIFMLRGGFDWITSGGDKEKIKAARERLTNAVVGIFILIAVLAIIATLENLVFQKSLCFGLTCAITLPTPP